MVSLQVNRSQAYTTMKLWNAQTIGINPRKHERIEYILDSNKECFVKKSIENSLNGHTGAIYLVKNGTVNGVIRVTVPMRIVRIMELKHRNQVEWINKDDGCIFRRRSE